MRKELVAFLLPWLFRGTVALALGVFPGPASAQILNLETIDGQLPPAKIKATGTASGTTYLRGDGVWGTPAGGVSDGDKGDVVVSGSGATWTVDTGVIDFSELSGTATDAQIPNTVTVDNATTAATANAGDSATGFFPSGTLEDARVDGAAESDEITGLTDAQISDALTASTSTTASANDNDTSIATTAFVQQELDDVDLLSDNCVLENDSTPIPDSCVGDGSDASGGGGGTVTTLLRTTGTQANSTTAFADVTGLTVAVTAATYHFHCTISYTSAVSTTALQVSVNGPTNSALDYCVETSTTATARHNACQTAYDTVTNPATGGAATRLPVQLTGTATFTASGTFAVRFRSEVAASAVTMQRGASCRVWN